MEQPTPRLRRTVILLMLLFGVGLTLVVVGQLAVETNLPGGALTLDARRTAGTALAGLPTPVSLFGPIDPAIIPALQGTPGSRPFGVLPEVAPIGIYLPGTTPQPQLPTLTPSHTPTPVFTATPTTTSTPVFTATPTRTPTRTRTPTPRFTRTPRPTPIASPTDPLIPDPGGAALGSLKFTPNPNLIGRDCAPNGMPAYGVLTQRFHYWHSGADIGVPLGTPVRTTHSGQVIYADWSSIGYGWLVIIQNGPYITYYAHNTSFTVAQFQYVRAGDIVAYSGSTGNSSGPHIHYETRINGIPVDPLTFSRRNLPTC